MAEDFTSFVGIDVSKEKIDIFCLGTSRHAVVANNRSAIKGFFNKINVEDTFVVLENTGGYERTCLDALLEKGITVHRTNNNKLHGFMKSMGRKAKTDKIDSQILAIYGEKNWRELEPYRKPAEREEKIRQLAAYLAELKSARVKEKNRLQSHGCQLIQDFVAKTLELLDENIQEVEKQLDELVDQDPDVRRKKDLLCEFNGVGKNTAIQLLAHLPELGKVSRGAIAALSGTAPYARDSGTKRGYRCTRGGGRPIVKRTLFMASLSAIRHNKKLSAYYEKHKLMEKSKMKIMVAVMRKMVVQLNAILKAGYIMD